MWLMNTKKANTNRNDVSGLIMNSLLVSSCLLASPLSRRLGKSCTKIRKKVRVGANGNQVFKIGHVRAGRFELEIVVVRNCSIFRYCTGVGYDVMSPRATTRGSAGRCTQII